MKYLANKYSLVLFFFFNDTATTEIYTLSLHDALPIDVISGHEEARLIYLGVAHVLPPSPMPRLDRKSTRLNSSHQIISYAVFCLKKKKKNSQTPDQRKRLLQIKHH